MTQVIGTSPLNQMSTPTQAFSVMGANAHRKKHSPGGKLNLVSLMDIFTILVFFLMLNSGDVEVLQPDESIQLPKSAATLKPDDVPVIKITNDQILFRDEALVSLSGLPKGEGVPQLERALLAYAKSAEAKKTGSEKPDKLRGVSIMSDSSVNYATLKRVLYSSAQAGYRDIGLATEFGQANSSESNNG